MRSSVLLVATLILCGCDTSAEDSLAPPADCDNGPAFAREPATGECWEFVNSCEVFPDWPACEPCASSADCAAPEHCRLQPVDVAEEPTPGVCTDACTDDTECLSTQHCDVTTDLCVDGPAGTPPPVDADCSGNAGCIAGEVCPAQFGGCSPTDPSTGILCPSVCEVACADDSGCAATDRCNAVDVCATPQYDEADSPPAGCFGWCVPR